jgi:3-dehydroquinate synthase
MTAATIEVRAEHRYQVVIGRSLDPIIPGSSWITSGRRVLVVSTHDSDHVAATVRAALESSGMRVSSSLVDRGESAKSVSSVERVWQACADAALDRTSIIVAVGGGTVTDVVGFAAATWMRGIDWVAIPTTTAGMVDAAIGGKTGINAAGGKNLVGSFHSPVAVLCATDTLRTLPRADYAAGFVEALKCGFIADPEILSVCALNPEAVFDAQSEPLHELITRAVRVKAEVVSADFTESQRSGVGREVLNYGHTFGHALEALSGYQMRHGDAVAVGMVFAAEVSEVVGIGPAGLADSHREVLQRLGVPTAHAHRDFEPLLALMGRDKKARDGVIRFVLVDAIGSAVGSDAVPGEALAHAFERTREVK